jgi:ParB-like chromosome segregation protein Spo0J
MNIETVPIEKIIVDPSLNIRSDCLSQAKIAEYAETFKQLPAISVFKVDNELYLIDGWHRLAAARKLEKTDVECIIVGSGTIVEACDMADEANLRHGIPLTPEQRRQVAVRFAQRHPDWSLREIADKMGCSYQSVKNWIDSESVKNLTVDAPNQKSASQGDRAANVDIKAVVLKFREWFNTSIRRSPIDAWTPERKVRVKEELKPIVEFYQTL